MWSEGNSYSDVRSAKLVQSPLRFSPNKRHPTERETSRWVKVTNRLVAWPNTQTFAHQKLFIAGDQKTDSPEKV